VSEDLIVFRNSVAAARAIGDDGVVWSPGGPDLTGPPGSGWVRIADNASPRWGPGWEQDGWANRVSAEDGVASYAPVALRRTLAWISGSVLALGLIALGFSRREERG
jgi:hypothetical protein